jgi:uncharacterized repeat protein (TIGR03803 family)
MGNLRIFLLPTFVSKGILNPHDLVQSRWLRMACCVFVLCIATAVAAPAQTFTLLDSFSGTDGAAPVGMVQGADGNFYGTTLRGGASGACTENSLGCGTVFEITPAGTLTTLHSFAGGSDGLSPNGLIQGTDGKFYGTTSGGGAGANCSASSGCGIIYSIVPGGTPVTLYSFCSLASCADGFAPQAGLVQGSDGNFYGTTSAYGDESDYCSNSPCGTVFKITPTGVLTILYTFSNPGMVGGFSPPYGPASALVQGSDGNFYGTTLYGGNQQCGVQQPGYCGTVFKITPSGTLTTLYNFCSQTNCTDGFGPSGLVQGADGNFYGTTSGGGAVGVCPNLGTPYLECGTIFKITPSGTLTTLHSFDSTDGVEGNGLIQGTDGNFYGVTTFGGNSDSAGTIFKMTPQGTVITLYAFNGTTGDFPDGLGPDWLLQATNGLFYGTAIDDGANNDGTIFSFAVGMGGTTASTTTLSLSPSIVSVNSGESVTMTATVTAVSGSGTPTGTVEFFNGTNAVGFAYLNSGAGSTSYSPTDQAVGSYQITAVYSGDATYAMSTSSPQTLTISTTPPAATPTFSPAAGSYNSPQSVTIFDTTTGAIIFYTTDGTTPTTSSAIYSGPIAVNSTEIIQAMAAASGYINSSVATATYTITQSPSYQVSVNPTALTIAAGQTGTAMFTVTPSNGFNSQVNFSCTGLPSEATCAFSPASVTPTGSNPVTSTLTITTTGASAGMRTRSSLGLIYAFLFPGVGMVFTVGIRRRHALRRSQVIVLMALLLLAAWLTSCGGSSSTGGNLGTQPGTSTVTVTATAGTMSQTATLTVTITQ